MGCAPSKPPSYTTVEYVDKNVLEGQLRMLTVTTDPLQWKIAFVQVSTRLAAAHGRPVIPVDLAFRSFDVVVKYAHAALLELRTGAIKSTDGFLC